MGKWVKRIFIIFIVYIMGFSIGFADEEINYRIIMFGNSDYLYKSDLKGPPFDLERLQDVFMDSNFGDKNLKPEIFSYQNVVKETFLGNIEKHLINADENDISILYYTGHGAYDKNSNQAYLAMVDANDYERSVSTRELESVLDQIKGTKILLIDACESGGFIHDPTIVVDNVGNNNLFNEAFISVFEENTNNKIKAKSFNRDNYKVITAAAENQSSFEYYMYGIGFGGEFTNQMVKGLGYLGDYLANDNKDDKISFYELYSFLEKQVTHSDVQSYPKFDMTEIYGLETYVPVESFELKNEKKIVKKDSELIIDYVYYPKYATNTKINWESNNKEVVDVLKDGRFDIKGSGIATLTAKIDNNKLMDTVKIYILDNNIINFSIWNKTKIYFINDEIKVKFNNLISKSSKLKVINKNGLEVPIEMDFSELKTIKFKLDEDYFLVGEYFLLIDNEIYDINRNPLEKGIVFPFEVK